MPEIVENRMLVDSEYENIEKKLNGAGYYNPRTGVFVPETDALNYMIEILRIDLDTADEIMEHFYKNWIKED